MPGRRVESVPFRGDVVQRRSRPAAWLCVPGSEVNAEVQWALPGILKDLAKDYRVIAYDNRGHGKSGKPHDPKKYGMEMVEDAVRLPVSINVSLVEGTPAFKSPSR